MISQIHILVAWFVGLVFIILALPLMKGQIPPNRWYGFRVPSTLRNEKLWYPVNRVAGIYLAGAGAATLVMSLFLIVFDVGPAAGAKITVSVLVVGSLVMVVQSFRTLFRLKKNQP